VKATVGVVIMEVVLEHPAINENNSTAVKIIMNNFERFTLASWVDIN
jgi:hypothetical protein